MELKKALELQVQYYGSDGVVRVDENGYVCLNDLALFFPNKDISNWTRSADEFIKTVDAELNSVDSTELKTSVIAKRGRYKSGTYAHKWVAMHFAMWLSPEFNLKIIKAFEQGTQQKENWNIKRVLAAENYKLMCDSIKNAHETPKHYHYSNEALMLNEIVFGIRAGDVRDNATEAQLDAISWLEGRNGAYIDLDMDYQSRKERLTKMYNEKYLPKQKELS